MGSCSKRHFLLTVCVLQLISTLAREVFDFLGYMWTPILLNFFNIVFVIFGFFGGYQFRPRYIITYSVWNLLWLAWNIFIICFYLSVGILDKESSILNLGTGSVSWWEANGPGCKAVFSPDQLDIDPTRQYRPTSITDCLFQYEHVEIAQACWQCILACLGIISGVCLSRIFIEEDDSFDFMAGDGKSPRHLALQPMYVSYTSLTQSSKRDSLSSAARRHQKTGQTTFDTTSRCSTVTCSSRLTLPPYKPSSGSYRKPFNVLEHAADSRPRPPAPVHADQIRNAARVDYGHGYGISRSKSHERLSRRKKTNDGNAPNPRPKSLCARTSFVDS